MTGPALPEHVERPPDSITTWVIYERPDDFPQGYVLRPQFSVKYFEGCERFGIITETFDLKIKAVVIVSPIAWYGETADELRALLPSEGLGGVINIGRRPGDMPSILEVWLDMRTDTDTRR